MVTSSSMRPILAIHSPAAPDFLDIDDIGGGYRLVKHIHILVGTLHVVVFSHDTFHCLGVGLEAAVHGFVVLQRIVVFLDFGFETVYLTLMLIGFHQRVVAQENHEAYHGRGDEESGAQIAARP